MLIGWRDTPCPTWHITGFLIRSSRFHEAAQSAGTSAFNSLMLEPQCTHSELAVPNIMSPEWFFLWSWWVCWWCTEAASFWIWPPATCCFFDATRPYAFAFVSYFHCMNSQLFSIGKSVALLHPKHVEYFKFCPLFNVLFCIIVLRDVSLRHAGHQSSLLLCRLAQKILLPLPRRSSGGCCRSPRRILSPAPPAFTRRSGAPVLNARRPHRLPNLPNWDLSTSWEPYLQLSTSLNSYSCLTPTSSQRYISLLWCFF